MAGMASSGDPSAWFHAVLSLAANERESLRASAHILRCYGLSLRASPLVQQSSPTITESEPRRASRLQMLSRSLPVNII